MYRAVHRVILAGLVALSVTAAAQGSWIITEIPNLPEWVGSAEAADINNSGVVCGMGNYVINTSSTPFRFDGTTVTELPILPDADKPIALTTGINASGVICGYSRNAAGKSRACYWVDTTLHTIPYPPEANPDSDLRAYDINDDGVVVGYFWSTGGERTAFYFQDGVSYSLDSAIRAAGLTDLQTASAVNNSNVICGSADDPSGNTTAYTYDIDAGLLTVIGTIGITDCSATDINDAGQIIGRGKYYPWDAIHRVVTYDGTWHFVDYLTPDSQWTGGINDQGRIVGTAYVTGGGRWSWFSDGPGDGSMVPLDLAGWGAIYARKINNEDWIAGYGESPTSGDETVAFILKPPPGDADHDGDVDLGDYEHFHACMSGPVEGAGFVPPSQDCLDAFDFAPADGDVDVDDFVMLQRVFEGG